MQKKVKKSCVGGIRGYGVIAGVTTASLLLRDTL